MAEKESALPVTGRALASRVLLRVEKDNAYAAAALDAELGRYPQMDPRERGLATEIVYGVLRARSVLLERLERFAPRGLERTDRQVVMHLLVAAYQILLLDRIPPFAAVDSAVELVRLERGKKLAGFANAVLRKLAADGSHLDRGRTFLDAAPAWLRERLERDVGADEARALLGASDDAAVGATTLRVRAGRPEPSWLTEAERGRVAPYARILRGEGDLRRRPGYAAGDVVIQEEGAQVVALALGARPGERVLDACAGRGQKTALLSEQMASAGELWAADVHPSKLAALCREHEKLGLVLPKTLAVDLASGTASLPSDFDRVLVDAPCTGSGTLRRRPEIALKLGPDDPARLGRLAEKILRNAGGLTKPGGRVVFAVCSVFREESEDVVQRVADLFEPVPFDAPELRGIASSDQTMLRLLPLQHGTDGYFIASLRRR